MGMKECPKCKTICDPKNPEDPRIRCQICRKLNGGKDLPDWCWHCQHEWNKGGSSSSACQSPCGNSDCTGRDHRLDEVQNCALIDIRSVKKTPSMRLCPNCGFLQEFRHRCIAMTCKFCMESYCFGCLKIGRYPCGGNGDNCPGAPIQTSIPVMKKMPR